MIDIDKLKQVAPAATQGEWEINIDSTCSAAWPEFGTRTDEDGFLDIGRTGTSHVLDYANYDSSKVAASYDEALHYFVLKDEQSILEATFIAAANPSAVLELIDRLEAAELMIGAKQAKIDALMLEYCPEEMSQQQVDEWAKNQKAMEEKP